MKKFLVLLVMVCVFSGQVMLVQAQESAKNYHIDKYPGVGGLLSWGMSVEDIEAALNKKLSNVGQNKYRVIFTAGGLEFDAILIVSGDGLNALVLKFNMISDKFYGLLDTLKAIYGDPSAVDTEQGAVQWKDAVNDTGVVIVGERDGVYSVAAGLRVLKERGSVEDLGPGKVSVLEGITLGMSEEDFSKQYKHFEAKKLPYEKGMPVGAAVYQAFITFNLIPSEVFFEFNQEKLSFIMVQVSMESRDKDYLLKMFNSHLEFLSKRYGSPSDETASQVMWIDGGSELRFGLHPLGMFAVSWEALK